MPKWLLLILLASVAGLGLSSEEHLIRKRRYLVFPKGSSVQVVYCFLGSADGTEGIFTIGITVGLAWEIPINFYKFLREHTDRKKLLVRERRSLYSKIKASIDNIGFDGYNCILRFLCETEKRNLQNRKPNFQELLVYTLFNFPEVEAEDDLHARYNEALNYGKSNNGTTCQILYPCSILNFVLHSWN